MEGGLGLLGLFDCLDFAGLFIFSTFSIAASFSSSSSSLGGGQFFCFSRSILFKVTCSELSLPLLASMNVTPSLTSKSVILSLHLGSINTYEYR